MRSSAFAATLLGLSLTAACGSPPDAAAPPADAAPAAAPTVPAATSGPSSPDAEPAAPAPKRFVPPLKGTADVQVLPSRPRRVGNEVHTTLKLKNVSNAPIQLLKIDEFWYDKAGNMLPGDTQRHRQPFMPGEIIEITLRIPVNPNMHSSNYVASHANGKVMLKQVKTFQENQ